MSRLLLRVFIVFVAARYFHFFKAVIDGNLCSTTLSMRRFLRGILNAFVSVYLLEADTLHTDNNVAHLGHCNFYWFCLVCTVLSLTLLLLFAESI